MALNYVPISRFPGPIRDGWRITSGLSVTLSAFDGVNSADTECRSGVPWDRQSNQTCLNGPRAECQANCAGKCHNLRVKKQFTDLYKDRFRNEGFEYITKFFEHS